MSFGDLSPVNDIEGGTDGTVIGNVSDRLKTEATISGDTKLDIQELSVIMQQVVKQLKILNKQVGFLLDNDGTRPEDFLEV